VAALKEKNYKEVVRIGDEARDGIDRNWNPKLF